MDKERLKELADDPRFISGIYNYCDRWCERCLLASRCLNFAMQEDDAPDPEARDIRNEAFWQRLSETFRVTLELVQETAEEQGIDLSSIDDEDTEREERRRDRTAENHDCCVAAMAYVETVKKWFDSAEAMFEEKGMDLSNKALLGLPDSDPEKEALDLKDAVEIIRWYQYQIYVKLVRAVRGTLKERPEILKDFPKDSDGSAKVALIGTDRSIGAWGEMRGHFPERENDILDILVHLNRIRTRVEEVFPDARAFVRPGFDEPRSCPERV